VTRISKGDDNADMDFPAKEAKREVRGAVSRFSSLSEMEKKTTVVTVAPHIF
jgi:hypothetical protein